MADVEINETADLEAIMEQLEVEVRNKWARRAVKAGGTVYARDLRKRVPQSSKTGSSELQSKATKEKRDGTKELKKNIKVKVSQYDGGVTVAIAGAHFPDGAHFHLVNEDHEHVAWGHRTGATIHGKQMVVAAIEATKEQQHEAVVAKLHEGIVAEGG